jgi:hypothetical protein
MSRPSTLSIGLNAPPPATTYAKTPSGDTATSTGSTESVASWLLVTVPSFAITVSTLSTTGPPA